MSILLLQGDESIAKTPSSGRKPLVPAEGRKMWVQVKATGDVVEINLDKDRPISFESKDAELQWDRATAKNALKLKEKVRLLKCQISESVN